MSKFTFSLNSTFVKETDRLQLIKCIRWIIYNNLPLVDCIRLANRMIAGETIELDVCGNTTYPSFMDVVHHKDPDPYAESRMRQNAIARLLELGASGDSEAAIAYCKHMFPTGGYIAAEG